MGISFPGPSLALWCPKFPSCRDWYLTSQLLLQARKGDEKVPDAASSRQVLLSQAVLQGSLCIPRASLAWCPFDFPNREYIPMYRRMKMWWPQQSSTCTPRILGCVSMCMKDRRETKRLMEMGIFKPKVFDQRYPSLGICQFRGCHSKENSIIPSPQTSDPKQRCKYSLAQTHIGNVQDMLSTALLIFNSCKLHLLYWSDFLTAHLYPHIHLGWLCSVWIPQIKTCLVTGCHYPEAFQSPLHCQRSITLGISSPGKVRDFQQGLDNFTVNAATCSCLSQYLPKCFEELRNSTFKPLPLGTGRGC